MWAPRGWLFAAALGAAACRVYGPGLSDAASISTGGDLDGGPDAALDGADGAVDQAPDTRPPAADRALPPPLTGPPALVGCSDGSREGFLDLQAWPVIAGCSGGWQVPGVIDQGQEPRCGRQGGNDSVRADGEGCSVVDLCAEGWHVCRGPAEVSRRSPSGCESAVAPGLQRLFIVAAGASPLGVCIPDGTSANDLHGCGDFGSDETSGCYPLLKRLTFADCLQSGVWYCGTADDHLVEATVVTKAGSALGGVLCCHD
jgi:hypothetical protein